MSKLLLLIPAFCFGFILNSEAQVNSTVQGELSNLILEQNADYYVQYRTTKDFTNGFIARFFIYKIKNSNWPGGVGFEITHPDRNEPLWYTMIHGDFGPHSVQLLDIDRNGKLDLFFYVGFEDVFSTYIYSANYKDPLSDPFRKDNFINSYKNENNYSVLIRPDGANRPIILDSGYEGNENKSGTACLKDQSAFAVQEENRVTLTDSVKNLIELKYREVTGDLDKYNFDYNMPDVYFLLNTMILDPVKLFKIDKQKSIEVTSEYPNYLKWRIEILEQIKSDSPVKCKDIIANRIQYLRNYLDR